MLRITKNIVGLLRKPELMLQFEISKSVCYSLMVKEAYTWWRHLADHPKIGGLEKNVAAFSLAAWCVYSANLPSLNTLKSFKTKTNPNFGDILFSWTSEFSTHQIIDEYHINKKKIIKFIYFVPTLAIFHVHNKQKLQFLDPHT